MPLSSPTRSEVRRRTQHVLVAPSAAPQTPGMISARPPCTHAHISAGVPSLPCRTLPTVLSREPLSPFLRVSREGKAVVAAGDNGFITVRKSSGEIIPSRVTSGHQVGSLALRSAVVLGRL